MRSFCTAMWITVAWVVLAAMVWMIYGVLSQPMMASEKVSLKNNGLLRPGYIQAPVAPQKPATVTTGRVTAYALPSERIYLKTYETPSYRVTTGRIGTQRIHVKEYKPQDKQ
jgi:hypothetical protein